MSTKSCFFLEFETGADVKTDDICEEYSDEGVGLTPRILKDDEEFSDTVLIEGSSRALSLLGKLLLAVANGPNGDGFSLSPDSAGSVHFSNDSELGFYIHKTKSLRLNQG
jgi:hypothetical protein